MPRARFLKGRKLEREIEDHSHARSYSLWCYCNVCNKQANYNGASKVECKDQSLADGWTIAKFVAEEDGRMFYVCNGCQEKLARMGFCEEPEVEKA